MYEWGRLVMDRWVVEEKKDKWVDGWEEKDKDCLEITKMMPNSF